MKLDHAEVMAILPHRPPILLVDTVTDLVTLEHIETSFYVDPEMEVFKGHFPGDPVFPGVLSVECIAQASDIMIMTDPRYAGKAPLFSGIEKVRFLRRIAPGDTVTGKVSVKEINQEKAKITCEGNLFVQEELAVIATVTIAMR